MERVYYVFFYDYTRNLMTDTMTTLFASSIQLVLLIWIKNTDLCPNLFDNNYQSTSFLWIRIDIIRVHDFHFIYFYVLLIIPNLYHDRVEGWGNMITMNSLLIFLVFFVLFKQVNKETMNESLNGNPMNPSSSSFSGGLETIAASCKFKFSLFHFVVTILFICKLEMKEPRGISAFVTLQSCHSHTFPNATELFLKKCVA